MFNEHGTQIATQRECDYAAFTPDTLGGPGLEGVGLWTDDRRWSASALSLSLMHVQGVLTAAGCSKEAFPVQAIVEHVSLECDLVCHIGDGGPRNMYLIGA